MADTTLYDVLGVGSNATEDVIRKAFRRKAMECHPDKVKGKEEQFQRVNQAYQVLGDSRKRMVYDATGSCTEEPAAMSVVFPDDLLMSCMFGQNDAPNRDDAFPDRPTMDKVVVLLTVEELCLGCTKCVDVDVVLACPDCKGVGAMSPSDVLRCTTCHGAGSLAQGFQLGPFVVQGMSCPACGGAGRCIRTHSACRKCQGARVTRAVDTLHIVVPPGVPDRHVVVLRGRGSVRSPDAPAARRDLKLSFRHDIHPPYSLSPAADLHMDISISLQELLGGFCKEVSVVGLPHVLQSKGYFNPVTCTVPIAGAGLVDPETRTRGKVTLRFTVTYPASTHDISRYNEVFARMFRAVEPPLPEHVPVVHVVADDGVP